MSLDGSMDRSPVTDGSYTMGLNGKKKLGASKSMEGAQKSQMAPSKSMERAQELVSGFWSV